MNKTIQAIIDLMRATADQWDHMADQYQTILDVMGESASEATKASHRSSVITYRTCALDQRKLADEIEERTIGKETDPNGS